MKMGGGGGGQREGGVWHQNRIWFSEGRKGFVHDAWLSLKIMHEAWILQKGKGGWHEIWSVHFWICNTWNTVWCTNDIWIFLKFECETESGHSLPPPLCYPLFRLLKLKQEIHFQFFPSWPGGLSQLEVFNRVWVSAKCCLYAFQRHTVKDFIKNPCC